MGSATSSGHPSDAMRKGSDMHVSYEVERLRVSVGGILQSLVSTVGNDAADPISAAQPGLVMIHLKSR
ncbi:hypothetical protein PMIN04_003890 [Paraphaeosphaeria minitans]